MVSDYAKEGIHKRIIQIVLPVIFALAAIYFALSPSSLAIFLIEYLKLPPYTCIYLIEVCLPIIVGLVGAEILAVAFSIRYIHTICFIIKFLLLPAFAILWAIYYFVMTLLQWMFRSRTRSFGFDSFDKCFHKCLEIFNDENIKKFGISSVRYNAVFLYSFIILIPLLFASYASDNLISHLWLSKFNARLEVTANAHYYCQILSNYAEEDCNKWKAKIKNMVSH